mgnify:CR=1 FL=1
MKRLIPVLLCLAIVKSEKTPAEQAALSMEKGNYSLSVATTYSEGPKTPELKVVWEQLTTCITEYSWQAIYAESDEDFDKIITDMIGIARSYDPQQKCLAWCENEAATRNALEEPLRK